MTLQSPILITVFDKTLTAIAVIDDYESASFERHAYQPGAFSMVINWNKANAAYVQRGNYIMWNGDPTKCAKITHVALHLDEGGRGGESITASGVEPWGVFSQRIVLPPSGSAAYVLSGNPEYVIKQLISDQCGATASDANRKFSLFTVATNQNRYQTAYPSYSLSAQNTNVLDEIKKICAACQVGIVCTLNTVTKLFSIDITLGVDRSVGNGGGNKIVILASVQDTVQTVDLDDTEEAFANLAYVRSGGSAGLQTVLPVTLGATPTAEARFEKFVDASTYPTTDATLTADLTAAGAQALQTLQFTKLFNAQPIVQSPYSYGTDYLVMDILTAQEFNVTQNCRLISMVEAVQALQYTLTATYDKAVPDLPTQVAAAIASIVSDVNNSQAAPIFTTNASGSAVRFTDGTMIEWGAIANFNLGTGFVYGPGVASNITHSIPISFVNSSYYYSGSGHIGGRVVFTNTLPDSQTASAPAGYVFDPYNTTQYTMIFLYYTWLAVGRWK